MTDDVHLGVLPLDVHVLDDGVLYRGPNLPVQQSGPDSIRLSPQSRQIVDEIPPHRSIHIAAMRHRMPTLGLYRPKVHQLEVDTVGISVPVAAQVWRVCTEILQQAAELHDLGR